MTEARKLLALAQLKKAKEELEEAVRFKKDHRIILGIKWRIQQLEERMKD